MEGGACWQVMVILLVVGRNGEVNRVWDEKGYRQTSEK